jgi:hypothetical protein
MLKIIITKIFIFLKLMIIKNYFTVCIFYLIHLKIIIIIDIKKKHNKSIKNIN